MDPTFSAVESKVDRLCKRFSIKKNPWNLTSKFHETKALEYGCMKRCVVSKRIDLSFRVEVNAFELIWILEPSTDVNANLFKRLLISKLSLVELILKWKIPYNGHVLRWLSDALKRLSQIPVRRGIWFKDQKTLLWYKYKMISRKRENFAYCWDMYKSRSCGGRESWKLFSLHM